MRALKEEFNKDIEQGILLDGLTKLINSNTENITKLINSNTENMTLIMTTKKSEASSTPVSTDAGTSRVSKQGCTFFNFSSKNLVVIFRFTRRRSLHFRI